MKQKSKVITRTPCVILVLGKKNAARVCEKKRILLINARSAPLVIKIKHPPPSQTTSHVVCLQTNAGRHFKKTNAAGCVTGGSSIRVEVCNDSVQRGKCNIAGW